VILVVHPALVAELLGALGAARLGGCELALASLAAKMGRLAAMAAPASRRFLAFMGSPVGSPTLGADA